MSCSLAIVTLCLLNPSYTEVRADVSSKVGGDFRYWSGGERINNAHVGVIELRLAGDLTSTIQLHYGVRHVSILNTRSDRGEERAFVGFTWRPFR